MLQTDGSKFFLLAHFLFVNGLRNDLAGLRPWPQTDRRHSSGACYGSHFIVEPASHHGRRAVDTGYSHYTLDPDKRLWIHSLDLLPRHTRIVLLDGLRRCRRGRSDQGAAADYLCRLCPRFRLLDLFPAAAVSTSPARRNYFGKHRHFLFRHSFNGVEAWHAFSPEFLGRSICREDRTRRKSLAHCCLPLDLHCFFSSVASMPGLSPLQAKTGKASHCHSTKDMHLRFDLGGPSRNHFRFGRQNCRSLFAPRRSASCGRDGNRLLSIFRLHHRHCCRSAPQRRDRGVLCHRHFRTERSLANGPSGQAFRRTHRLASGITSPRGSLATEATLIAGRLVCYSLPCSAS